MPLPFFENNLKLGIAFLSVRDIETELNIIFRDVILKANNLAFTPINLTEWGESSALNNKDSFHITTEDLEVQSSITANTNDGKRIEISNCKYTFGLEFSGLNSFDIFFLLKNNFKTLAESFEDLSHKDSKHVSYFDTSRTAQNVSYQKSDSAKISNITWSNIVFNCYIVSSVIDTIKDINFFIKYGR